MSKPTEIELETFCRDDVLPSFPLPRGTIRWRGSSEMDASSFIYFFELNDKNYVILQEETPGAMQSYIKGDAVAPHQNVRRVFPIDKTYVNVYIPGDDSPPSYKQGYFSLFEIHDSV